jgi:hypothetical protein
LNTITRNGAFALLVVDGLRPHVSRTDSVCRRSSHTFRTAAQCRTSFSTRTRL